MQYTEGTLGRVFFVRVDHGEDLLEELGRFVRDKNIRTGFIHFLGALSAGRLVTGPKELTLPPDPSFEQYQGGWEVVGLASITTGANGPKIHYHASIGKKQDVLTGCLREQATAYIIVEAVIVEVTGGTVSRARDNVTGLELPEFAPPTSNTGS